MAKSKNIFDNPPFQGFRVLCTGGAGYIGSHTVVGLLERGYITTILDNFCQSHEDIIFNIRKISSINCDNLEVENIDLCDKEALFELFKRKKFDAVIHYAGLKAVDESIKVPLKYYKVNVCGSINLLEAMKENNVKTLVFSSSATVYKDNNGVALKENDILEPCNPYGRTKLMVEQILQDICLSDDTWKIAILRYFNPIGAHISGKIGEMAINASNLLPIIQKVSQKTLKELLIFGGDWNTPDGTGVRDYIHVHDLMIGHIATLHFIYQNPPKCHIYNLGTGKGTSVLELKNIFEQSSNTKIPFKIVERRKGDLSNVIADSSKAKKELMLPNPLSIQDACDSAWLWQCNNKRYFDGNQL